MAGLLAFTGCSNIDGTAGNQTARKNYAGWYLEQEQASTMKVVDEEPDPTYEWFY
jgi:hypothetical protein